ncbi:unnamed protein product [Chondrus crispus]|uniref:Uncharacterized protein n=1 Tax=Chondrus crispus TaxID=2769 RepID=R7QBT7_CHOCR|nr:unnamed protein product [Chondrus crispus]CDF35504.1 unnamed protein product [Chondrus crispus]|eukprot:XP_005715323.1 unnamed protein product [Chondrus crispus]
MHGTPGGMHPSHTCNAYCMLIAQRAVTHYDDPSLYSTSMNIDRASRTWVVIAKTSCCSFHGYVTAVGHPARGFLLSLCQRRVLFRGIARRGTSACADLAGGNLVSKPNFTWPAEKRCPETVACINTFL